MEGNRYGWRCIPPTWREIVDAGLEDVIIYHGDRSNERLNSSLLEMRLAKFESSGDYDGAIDFLERHIGDNNLYDSTIRQRIRLHKLARNIKEVEQNKALLIEIEEKRAARNAEYRSSISPEEKARRTAQINEAKRRAWERRQLESAGLWQEDATKIAHLERYRNRLIEMEKASSSN